MKITTDARILDALLIKLGRVAHATGGRCWRIAQREVENAEVRGGWVFITVKDEETSDLIQREITTILGKYITEYNCSIEDKTNLPAQVGKPGRKENNMTYNELLKIADKGTLVGQFNSGGIVSLKFKIKDLPFHCQFSSGLKGLYAFVIEDDYRAVEVLKAFAAAT